MLRMNRSIQAEGTFAVMKEDRGFRRFLCRGAENVLAETVLMAVSQNIAQLHRKIQSGKTGTHLLNQKITLQYGPSGLVLSCLQVYHFSI